MDASSDYFREIFIKYQLKTTVIEDRLRGTKMTMIFFFFQNARWNCVDFPSVEIILKKYIRMTSIIRPWKLQQQSTSKWCGNLSILTCRRWFDLLSLLVRTKLVLVSTQNHHCFNIKFWRVDEMMKFRRSNADLFNVNIKILTSWAP